MKREVSQQELVSITDQQLVEEVRAGNRSSYSELVKRHQKGLLRLSMRFMKSLESAQDIVQDAFIKAYEKIDTFEGRSSFKSWLFQIAVNVARNKLRENKHLFADIKDIEIGIPSDIEKKMVHTEIGEMLQKEVERLPFKQKTALILRVYDDMSFAEIADIMDCPYDTAKANYRHALLKLKDVLNNRTDLQVWTNSNNNDIFSEIRVKFMEAE